MSAKDQKQKPQFQTDIPEPRWQQILAVIIVLAAIAGWLWLAFHGHKK